MIDIICYGSHFILFLVNLQSCTLYKFKSFCLIQLHFGHKGIRKIMSVHTKYLRLYICYLHTHFLFQMIIQVCKLLRQKKSKQQQQTQMFLNRVQTLVRTMYFIPWHWIPKDNFLYNLHTIARLQVTKELNGTIKYVIHLYALHMLNCIHL